MRVDLLEVGRHSPSRVEGVTAGLRPLRHGHAVHFEEGPDHLHIADVGNIAQNARRLAEERGHHRLGREVLRALHLDAAAQRPTARDPQGFSGHLLLS